MKEWGESEQLKGNFAGLHLDEIESGVVGNGESGNQNRWWWWGGKKVEVVGGCINGSKDKFVGLHLDDGNGE